MEKVENLIALYHLGHVAGQFALMMGHYDTTPHVVFPLCATMRTYLEHMLKLEPLPFEGSNESAVRLRAAIDSLYDACKEGRMGWNIRFDDSPTLYKRELLAALTELEVRLHHELDKMPIFFVTPCRGYSTEILIDGAEKIFGASEVEMLSAKTISDIREAGRAIAFELITAVGFHSVRAVEAVARGYHDIVIGAKPSEGTPLGPLIHALRAKRDALLTGGVIDKEDLLNMVIDFLTRINNIYRKPITHPDMNLEPQQALAVFESAKCAITLMLEDAPKKSAAGIPKAFF